MKKLFLLFSTVSCFIVTTNSALAIENRCVTRFNGYVKSKCLNTTMPRSKVRNISGHDLVCTGNVDNYVRYPQKYDFDKWNDLRTADPKEAYDYRRTLPEIKWSGRIPYSTVEVWTWESCEQVTSAMHCGTREECSTVTVNEPIYDKNGNQVGTNSREEEQCVDVPKTCLADISYYEAVKCSNEIMTYNAKYVRPSVNEWNLDTKGKYDHVTFLPNKYDLLPGEVEIVQTYNNGSKSARLSPKVIVGDAWNKYSENISGSGVGARCMQNSSYHIDVAINTIERNVNKKTPNAFKMPVAYDGAKIDPIDWDGTTNDITAKAIPNAIKLTDVAATMVATIAEQSHENAAREIEKAMNDQGHNSDAMREDDIKDSGFYKNTKVRVGLFKKRWWMWDQLWSKKIYTSDVESTQVTMNALSENQEISLSDLWKINLNDEEENANIYRGKFIDKITLGTTSGVRKLQSNRDYAFKVSMYQEGVPFYKQNCENRPGWDCKWFVPWPLKRSEDDYYSDDLEVNFTTKKNIDQRGFFQKIHDWTLLEGPLHWLGGKFK